MALSLEEQKRRARERNEKRRAALASKGIKHHKQYRSWFPRPVKFDPSIILPSHFRIWVRSSAVTLNTMIAKMRKRINKRLDVLNSINGRGDSDERKAFAKEKETIIEMMTELNEFVYKRDVCKYFNNKISTKYSAKYKGEWYGPYASAHKAWSVTEGTRTPLNVKKLTGQPVKKLCDFKTPEK